MAPKAQIVRLPDDVIRRLTYVSATSVRPISSLCTFALSDALTLAYTEPVMWRRAVAAHRQPGSGDARINLSVLEPTLSTLLTDLINAHADDETPLTAPQALRVALLTWTSARDADLITQVGAPPVPRRAPAMT